MAEAEHTRENLKPKPEEKEGKEQIWSKLIYLWNC